MTAIDLAAVCARHGIFASELLGEWVASMPVEGEVVRLVRSGHDTPADAVCALLKARWEMRTQQKDGLWHAEAWMWRTGQARTTELEAVVAVADRKLEDPSMAPQTPERAP